MGWYLLLDLIPVVGKVAAPLFTPFFCAMHYGEFAVIAHHQTLGEYNGWNDVPDKFVVRLGQLALLGLFPVFLVGGILYAEFDSIHIMKSLGLYKDAPDLTPWRVAARFAVYLAITNTFVYICMALPVFSTLVALGGKSALGALPVGLRAIFRNWAAFLVGGFAALLFVAGWGVVILMDDLVPLFARALNDFPFPFTIGTVLFAYLLAFFLTGFIPLAGYTASRDIFYEEG